MVVSSKRKNISKSRSKTLTKSKYKSRKNMSKTRKMRGGVKHYQAPVQAPKLNLNLNPNLRLSINSSSNHIIPDLRLKPISNPLPIPMSNPKLNPKWFHKLGASLGVSSAKKSIRRHQDEKEKEYQKTIANTVLKIEGSELFTKNKELAIYRQRLSNEISRNPLYINSKPLNKKMLNKVNMLKHINHMHDLVFQRATEADEYVKAEHEFQKQRLILDNDKPVNYLKMITEKNKALKRLYNLENPNSNY